MVKKESSAANLRSQFKATSIKSLKNKIDKDDATMGVQNNEYLNLEDGKLLKIRIFPAHPHEENFYVSKMCYWLPFTNGDGESKRRTVLDSIAHGGTEMDIVREYVRFAKSRYSDDAEKMEALVGTGMQSNSLNPQYSWLCYADSVKEDTELKPKLWEFKKMVRDLLNKLACSEDEDEPIEVDPFTDPDDGLVLAVKYLKKPNKKKGENYYEVDFAKTGKKKEAYSRPLTDEELENFMKMRPLSEIIPHYGMRDFEQALEGLQNFDEENGFDLFDDDEWLEIVEKVKAQYESTADDDDDAPKKKMTKKSAAAKSSKKQEDEDEDADDDDDSLDDTDDSDDDDDEEDEDGEEDEEDDADESDEFDEMERDDLKKYIKKNKLDIKVTKTMSDDDLRDAIREKVNAYEDEDGEDEEDEDEDDTEEEAPKKKISVEDIRRKLAKK